MDDGSERIGVSGVIDARQRGLRRTEAGLLVYPGLLLLLATVQLHVAQGDAWDALSLRLVGLFCLVVGVVHLALSRWLARADQVLLPIVAALAALGLVLVTRLEPTLTLRQLIWVILGNGLLLAAGLAIPHIRWLSRYRYTWLVGGLLVLGTTIVFGVDPNGSGMRLWLGFGGVYFQPSEILKIIVVIFFASYLAEKRTLITHASVRVGPLTLPPLSYLGPLIAVWFMSMGLLIWQRDLGAALLFYLVFIGLLYAATGSLYLFLGLLLFAVGAVVAAQSFDHVQLRIRVWLDPWSYATGDAYQIVQALGAFAAGGLFGRGLGDGYPDYVPAVHTDFVMAAIAEELGLFGSLGVVGLYLALIHRAFRIALRARNDFATLLATGLGVTLGVQTFIILAGNLRVIPITGITLPFLSYGGSSIVANFIMIGLLLRISAESSPGPERG